MIFKGDYFAKKYVGVEVFQKREDLMNAFIEYIKNKAKEISASDNPGLAFREKVVMTIRVRVINDVLMGDEFEDTRDQICEAINRGMKLASEKGLFQQEYRSLGMQRRFRISHGVGQNLSTNWHGPKWRVSF